MILLMGNPAPREWVTDDPATGAGHYQDVPIPGGGSESITMFPVPPGMGRTEVANTILAAVGGAWERQSSALPTWVASDDDLLAALMADDLGLGAPLDWPTAQSRAAALGLL